MPLDRSPEQLDRARRAWLANLAQEHRTASTAASAQALARAEWMCGEYETALAHFIEARDRAPHDPDHHLALMRAASMLGRHALEEAAIAMALENSPPHPLILLHAALRLIPSDVPAARELLERSPPSPLPPRFLAALTAIETDTAPALPQGDPRHQAEVAGMRWVMAHASGIERYTGAAPQVLQRALDAAGPEGLTLECGVYFGRSLRIIASRTPGQVHGFDSFEGLPEAWNPNEGPGAYSTAGRLPQVPANVTLHAGWFEDTLPPFFARHPGPIRLLHVDCDLYSSTRTVLEHAGPRLVPGSVLVFDDFLGYPGFEQHELRAFEEWATAQAVGWELIAATLLGREAAIRITRT